MGSPIAFQEIYKAGMEDFVIPSYEVAPNTVIQNRAMVTRSLKAIAGVERVQVKGINQLQNEFGPNGERVFEAENKDSRIRFIGSWTLNASTSGSLAFSNTVGDSFEVTFYGTGLNLVHRGDSPAIGLNVSIDGGANSPVTLPVYSTVLIARGYAPNVVYNLASGLTLGWHTIRASLTAQAHLVQGFEILNQRTDLAVYSGQGIVNGSSQGLNALTTSNFSAGVIGTRGARVIKYIQNGAVSQAVQEVDATSKFLTNTDHTNEEDFRRIYFKEFGVNRADDFSTIAGVTGARAFTLDDGTTTLTGNGINANGNMIAINNAIGNFLTLTFVGTGLDIVVENTWTNLSFSDVLVDGVSVGALTNYSLFGTTSAFRKVPLCSGLPYGTHTVRMSTNAGTNAGVTDFIIYRPKKPTIPTGAFKVCDYIIPGNYSALTTSGIDRISSGVIRKFSLREISYVGTWSVPSIQVANIGGFYVNTNNISNYAEYTFYGTGVDLRFATSAAAASFTISINGSTNLSGFTTSLVQGGTGVTWNPATGVVAGTSSNSTGGNALTINGLSLGRNTIRITQTSGASVFVEALDIITPIHFQEPSLKVGSQSLSSITKYSPEKSVSNAQPDLSKAKAWVVFDTANGRILSSMNVSAVLTQAGGVYVIYLEKPFKDANYVCIGSIDQPISGGSAVTFRSWKKNANHVYVETFNTAGANTAGPFTAAFFGEQIDE
jgi:hypothetical protein